MPDHDRRAWLRAVASGLGASPDLEAEILEELSSHLDDQVADLVAGGVEPADAEGRAIAGMGDPRPLGRDLARARRTPRAALALAGGGAFSVGFLTIVGAAAAWAAFTVFAGFSVTIAGLALSTRWWERAPGAYGLFATALVGLAWGVRTGTSALVERSPWPARRVRATVAGTLLVIGLPLVILLPDQELDAALVLLLLGLPVAAALVAATAPRRVRYAPGRATAAATALAVVLPALLWTPAGGAAPTFDWLGDPTMPWRPPAATELAGIDVPILASSGYSIDGGREEWTIEFSDLAGWHDLSAEVQVLEQAGPGSWRVAAVPGGPARFAFDGLTATATIPPGVTRTWTRTWLVTLVVGTAPDGVRSFLRPARRAGGTLAGQRARLADRALAPARADRRGPSRRWWPAGHLRAGRAPGGVTTGDRRSVATITPRRAAGSGARHPRAATPEQGGQRPDGAHHEGACDEEHDEDPAGPFPGARVGRVDRLVPGVPVGHLRPPLPVAHRARSRGPGRTTATRPGAATPRGSRRWRPAGPAPRPRPAR